MMTDRVILVCTIVVAVVYLYASTLIPTLDIGDPLGPKAFPLLLGVCLLIGAALLFIEMWKERSVEPRQPPGAEAAQWRYAGVIAAVTAWTAVYFAVLEKLGYVVSTAIYLLALMAWFNRGKRVTNIAAAVLFSALSYLLFVKLDVTLPKGILPF